MIKPQGAGTALWGQHFSPQSAIGSRNFPRRRRASGVNIRLHDTYDANSTEIECRALLQASGLDAPSPAVYVPPTAMLLRPTFIPPALPSPADRPPIGEWIHEIKHDGYRMMVRGDVSGVRLLTRNGKDWTGRFPA